MKLIDADALKQVTEESIAEYDDCYTRDTIFGMRSVVYYATTDAPTIDAVPVIRCKYCKWHIKGGFCDLYFADRAADEYCSKAERKEK